MVPPASLYIVPNLTTGGNTTSEVVETPPRRWCFHHLRGGVSTTSEVVEILLRWWKPRCRRGFHHHAFGQPAGGNRNDPMPSTSLLKGVIRGIKWANTDPLTPKIDRVIPFSKKIGHSQYFRFFSIRDEYKESLISHGSA